MHEILEFLANPYAFVVGSHPASTAFNLVMVGVTITFVVVAMLLPFPHGRGAIVPKARPRARDPPTVRTGRPTRTSPPWPDQARSLPCRHSL